MFAKGAKWNGMCLPRFPYYLDKFKLPLQLGMEFNILDIEMSDDVGD